MSLSVPAPRLTLVPIPLYRDTDDDLLQEPRERRVRHEPRPALRDPLASPAYRARFTSTSTSTVSERHAA